MNVNTLQVKENEDGDLFFELPTALLDRLGWEPGDDVKFEEKNGGFLIKKKRYETVELEFEEDELFKYMKHAHENSMSFNEWIEHVLTEVIDQIDSKKAHKYPRDIAQSD